MTPTTDGVDVRFVFFNVGHGACTLVSLPPSEAGGPRRYGVLDCHDISGTCSVESYLRTPPFPDEVRYDSAREIPLEFVALTHFDEDHFKGMRYLLGAGHSPFFVKRFLGPPFRPAIVAKKKYDHGSENYRELSDIHSLAYKPTRRRVRAGKAPELAVFADGIHYAWFPGIQMVGLAPLHDIIVRRTDIEATGNCVSGALLLRLQSRHVVVLGGDVEESEWLELARRDAGAGNRPNELQANVVGVPHHGGRGNPKQIWASFSRQHPRQPDDRRASTVAVISCGHNDGNPSLETCLTISEAGCAVYCTNGCASASENGCRRIQPTPQRLTSRDLVQDALAPYTIPTAGRTGTMEYVAPFTVSDRHPLDGAVCVDIRVDNPPNIIQLSV